VLGVLPRHLHQLRLGPATGNEHPDLGPPGRRPVLRQQGRQSLHRLDGHGQQELVGNERPGGRIVGVGTAVVLGHEAGHELVVGQAHPGQVERAHPDQASAPHHQKRGFGLVRLPEDPHHVLVDVPGAGDPLFFLDPVDGANLVPEGGRPLVLEGVRGPRHPPFEVPFELVVATLEEHRHVVDLPTVLRAVHIEHTRSRAAFDLILEARADPRLELRIPARSELEEPIHQPKRLSGRSRRMIRPEVTGAVVSGTPNDLQAGPGGLRVEPQIQELLVVPKLEVVAGLVLLDELILEERRLPLTGSDERL